MVSHRLLECDGSLLDRRRKIANGVLHHFLARVVKWQMAQNIDSRYRTGIRAERAHRFAPDRVPATTEFNVS